MILNVVEVPELYITDERFEKLSAATQLEWFYCPKCNRYYHKAALGGECGCQLKG